MPEIINRNALIQMIRNGKLDKSTAIDKDPKKYYLITKDITGRLCLGAIGSKHHLLKKVTQK